MPQPLPFSALRAFEAAARTGSFRSAAADIALTPSAVSHAIRGLEEALGTTLFLRQGRSICLTNEGRVLMHHVERGFGELLLGVGNVSRQKPRLLRVHSAPSFAAQWLMPRLRRLFQEVEDLAIRIAAGTDYPRFPTDDFDVDIVYGMPSPDFYGPSMHQTLIILPLGTEIITPLCAPSLAEEIRTPRDLLRQVLIESETKRVRWPAWFAANGLIAPEPRGPRFDRSFLSLSAAVDGLGVALESTRLAERELTSRRLVQPLRDMCENVIYTGHWLVFPRTMRYSRPLILFVEWLAAELGLELELEALDGPPDSTATGVIKPGPQ
jgi:LysR family glycine cleavage system transcriptional activator